MSWNKSNNYNKMHDATIKNQWLVVRESLWPGLEETKSTFLSGWKLQKPLESMALKCQCH